MKARVRVYMATLTCYHGGDEVLAFGDAERRDAEVLEFIRCHVWSTEDYGKMPGTVEECERVLEANGFIQGGSCNRWSRFDAVILGEVIEGED